MATTTFPWSAQLLVVAGGVDVEALARSPDAQVLQRLLPTVTFGDLDAEQLDGVDRNFVRLFRLAQVMLEYVLNRQEELVEQAQHTNNELEDQTQVAVLGY